MLPRPPSVFNYEGPGQYDPPAMLGPCRNVDKTMAEWMKVTSQIAVAQMELATFMHDRHLILLGAIGGKQPWPWPNYDVFREESNAPITAKKNAIAALVGRAEVLRAEWIDAVSR